PRAHLPGRAGGYRPRRALGRRAARRLGAAARPPRRDARRRSNCEGGSMIASTTNHATFTLERTYPVGPARVFAAFADPAHTRCWFAGPTEWEVGAYELDFRVGGRERASGGPAGGPVHTYDARYHDVVPYERIVLAYDMYADDTRISVSLGTWALHPSGTG